MLPRLLSSFIGPTLSYIVGTILNIESTQNRQRAVANRAERIGDGDRGS